MKRFLICFSMIAVAACGGGPQSGVRSVPGHGAISVVVDPNPIVAKRVTGNTFEFPFEVIVRETGGRPVNVTRVTMTVFGPGGFTVANESFDAQRIRSMGHPTSIAANGEIRIRLAQRREVPDARLLDGVTAQLTVEAVDDANSATTASTVVTVRT